MHVDTGAHYRTLTYALLGAGISPENNLGTKLDELTLGTALKGRGARLSVDDSVPADSEIRSPEVNASVSKFAAIPAVRKHSSTTSAIRRKSRGNTAIPGLSWKAETSDPSFFQTRTTVFSSKLTKPPEPHAALKRARLTPSQHATRWIRHERPHLCPPKRRDGHRYRPAHARRGD